MGILAILTLISQLIPLAEQIFTGIKQGQVKKAWVMDATQKAVGIATVVDPKAQVVSDHLSTIIDSVVGITNSISKLATGKEVIDTESPGGGTGGNQ